MRARSESLMLSSILLLNELHVLPQAAQALIESRLNLHFIRECVGIHKTRPKILPFVKVQNKNDLPCICVVCFTVWSLLGSFRSHFGDF